MKRENENSKVYMNHYQYFLLTCRLKINTNKLLND
jgi:hypothetical protein